MGNHVSIDADEDTEGLVGQQRCDEMLTRAALQRLASIPHLKETSFELIPSGQRQQFVSVKFKLSAEIPCRVSSFIIATEDRTTGAISCHSSAGITPPLRSKSPKQSRGPPPVHRASPPPYHTVCIPHLATSILATPIANPQPHCTLIIRVESLSHSLPAASPPVDLNTLPLGCSLPPGTNAHTVFATFRPGYDGLLNLVVLHRRMWLDGRCIDLPFVADPRNSMTQRTFSSSSLPSRSPHLHSPFAFGPLPGTASPLRNPRAGVASPTRAPVTPRQVPRSKSATCATPTARAASDLAPAKRVSSDGVPYHTRLPAVRPTTSLAAVATTTTASRAAVSSTAATSTAAASAYPTSAPAAEPATVTHSPSQESPPSKAASARDTTTAPTPPTTLPTPIAPDTASGPPSTPPEAYSPTPHQVPSDPTPVPPLTLAPNPTEAPLSSGPSAPAPAPPAEDIHSLAASGRSITLPQGARVKQLSNGALALHFSSPPPTLNSDLSHQVALILGAASKQATITTTKTTPSRIPSISRTASFTPKPPTPADPVASPPATPPTAHPPPTPPSATYTSNPGSALTTTPTTASTNGSSTKSTLMPALTPGPTPVPDASLLPAALPALPALPSPHDLATTPLTPPTTPPRSAPPTPTCPTTPPEASPRPGPSHASTPSYATPAASAVCKLCHERPIGVLTLPCYHCCMCTTCATNQQKRRGPCPMCGQALLHLMPISSVLAKTLQRSQCTTCLPNICGNKGNKAPKHSNGGLWGGVHAPRGPTKAALKKHSLSSSQPHSPPKAHTHTLPQRAPFPPAGQQGVSLQMHHAGSPPPGGAGTPHHP